MRVVNKTPSLSVLTAICQLNLVGRFPFGFFLRSFGKRGFMGTVPFLSPKYRRKFPLEVESSNSEREPTWLQESDGGAPGGNRDRALS